MSLLVVGSVAFDAVETPFGKREQMLGGSASHFSISASFFTDVRVVAVVGGDFGPEERSVFERHHVDTTDLEVVADGYVSVTPLHLDLTHDASLEALRERFA